MKKNNRIKRGIISLMLTAALIFGSVITGGIYKKNTTARADDGSVSRSELETVVNVLDGETNASLLNDDALEKKVRELIAGLKNGKSESASVDVNSHPEAYDENGAMKIPFDLVYPELVESGAVKYSDEALLVKMSGKNRGELTKAMRKAGVVKLEEIVPLENAAWYKAYLKEKTNASSALSALRQLREVKTAEYDYTIKTAGIDAAKPLPDNKSFGGNRYEKDQWYLNHCGIPDGIGHMRFDGGDPSVVVAVIDTGVDIDHEDLADNIWKNTGEIPGNGIDDDGNGYIDDYYGVNVITGKGDGDDDNGHGTHIAGIIAAKNNFVGVLGIAYNVKIMPVKAAMASGYLNQSAIAKAVTYAYQNGAEVINMSFGGSACSIAVQDALAAAYTRCVLVASAGNDGMYNEGLGAVPNYPAALSYVMGVMSINLLGVESSFTNWDVKKYNGVEYELYAPGEEMVSTLPGNKYGFLSGTSMAAPVVSAVAAIVRSEYQDRDKYPTKFIYGQLAATSGYNAICRDPEGHGAHNLPQIVDLYSALTKLPKPEVGLQSYALFDTEGLKNDTDGVNNGDGVIDAGETVALGLTLRNRWGMSDDTVVTIDAKSGAGIADPYIKIINPGVNYGSVGTYSTGDCGKIYTDELLTGWENPFYIQISKDCPNDYIFTLNVNISCKNGLNAKDKTVYKSDGTITLTVRSGEILSGTIEEDMTLTADKLYIIPNATVIAKGVTVKAEPGTHIQFWSDDAKDPYASDYIAYLKVNGRFLAEGTKENPVYIYPSDLMGHYPVELSEGADGYISLEYTDITNLYYSTVANLYYSTHNSNTGTGNTISDADHCTFRMNYGENLRYRHLSNGKVSDFGLDYSVLGTFKNVKNSIFYKIGYSNWNPDLYGNAERCIFVDCGIDFSFSAVGCVFLGNSFVDQTEPNKYWNSSLTLGSAALEVTNDDLKIYYREDTGTTYVRVSMDTNAKKDEKLLNYYMDKLGFVPAMLESQDEIKWAKANNLSGRLGIRYDKAKDRFVWNNGSEINSVIDPDGIAKTAQPNSLLYYNGTKLVIPEYNAYYVLYERSGNTLPTDITFEDYEINIDTESTYQIAPRTAPAQLTSDSFIYESRDESVVKVSESGLVTPVGKGTADVYVYSKDRALRNYITVNVVDYVPLEGLRFKNRNAETAIGENISSACALTPENTTRRNVIYSSSNEKVAAVDSAGNITGISSGTAEITARCEGFSDSITVTVYKKATSLKLNTVAKTVYLSDGEAKLPEVITDEGAETVLSWRSVDTEVAEISENRLVLKKAGTTTVEVTDSRSGLKANCFFMVNELKNGKAKKISSCRYFYFLLTEDGTLYYWSEYGYPNAPIIISKGVRDFSTYGTSDSSYFSIDILKNDGTVELWSSDNGSLLLSGSYDFLKGKENLIKIAHSYSNHFVLSSSGIAYAWGSNDYGSLGIGTIDNSENKLSMVCTDNIIDIAAMSETTIFLTNDGNLYYSGNGINSIKTDTPTLLAENVSQLFQNNVNTYNNNDIIYKTNSNEIIRTKTTGESTVFSLEYSYDFVYADRYRFMGIKDGYLYDEKQLPIYDISNAFLGCVGEKDCIVTEDGTLLKITTTGPQYIPIEKIYEDIKVVNTKQIGNTFTIYFNKVLTSVQPTMYFGENKIVINSKIQNLNQLVISRESGFDDGYEYRLVFGTGSVRIYGDMTNVKDITLTLLFDSSLSKDTPSAGDDGQVPTGGESQVTEKPIHKAELDTSIERVITAATLCKKINELQEKYQYNGSFYGNALLNRISTDTDVTHWLRLLAPSAEGEKIPLGGNWWGTTNEKAIGLQLIDGNDFITYARLIYSPYLTKAPEDVFPFVTDIAVLNSAGERVTTVGNEQITVRVSFNRDMDVTVPLLVRFGSAYPYGDYEITGKYVNARTWEGVYRLTTVIENGNQYFTVSNGCSATDDLALMPDSRRFAFVIDTSAAQALIMQGHADDSGIKLTWQQDDFDTLMGYNVYRSTAKDGLYVRINSSVIPVGTMEYFDPDVEPGVLYYYNFTVVKTDLSESAPSGKISIMSKDTMAPNIYHTPIYNATAGRNLVISATVTDNLHIEWARLYFRIKGETDWRIAVMNSFNDSYSAIIPAQYITAAGLEYYIEAFDGVSSAFKGNEDSPYTVAVREEISADALGDVNGDGKINALDALLILQARNDLINLNAEQFARADLDGDGELSAKEALRILQYASGAVGSLDMRG